MRRNRREAAVPSGDVRTPPNFRERAKRTTVSLTELEAAAVLLAAAGVAPGEVPPRPFGADWFREQPPWLAASTVADRLVNDPGFDPAEALMMADDMLAVDDLPYATAQLIEVGFVEAMVCSASHRPVEDTAELLGSCPPAVWQIWHRRRERLEALSEDAGSVRPPRSLESLDENTALLARCTTYRAESGRHVVLADLVSADNPSPWPLRHPILVGLIFAAVILGFLILSLVTAPDGVASVAQSLALTAVGQ